MTYNKMMKVINLSDNKINDFGEKIGGAKKDLWTSRGLQLIDIKEMNEAEKLKFIKKNNIWKTPDYNQLVSDGLPVRVAYFMKLIKDAAPTTPSLYRTDSVEDIKQKQERYIDFMGKLRDYTMNLKTEQEVLNFYDNFMNQYIIKEQGSYYIKIKDEANDCINNKLLKASQVRNFYSIDSDIRKKKFCYTEEQKALSGYSFLKYEKDKVEFSKDYKNRNIITISIPSGKCFLYPKDEKANPESWKEGTIFILKNGSLFENNIKDIETAKKLIIDISKELTKENIEITKKSNRKKSFVPEQLKHIKYDGPDYREGKNIKGEDYLREFNFKGGEFGNWLNNNDRQASLNYGYEAFHSLANALNIDNKDISINNNLSIAFGSRGSGKALAHYEPLREVINLTKMNGAGSLAHEWGHAIDDILNKSITGKALGQRNSRDLTQIQKNLTDIMKYKTIVVPNEEQIKKKEESINTARKHIETYLINVLPRDEKLTEEQIKRKNELVKKVINDKSIEWGNYISFNLGRSGKSDNVLTVESIDNLAAFVKETKHTRLNKDICKSINNFVSKLNDAKKIKIDEKQTVKVKTDFYKNSELFDTLFSKESKGYWSSDVEMFARAFSCYVDDKLKEQDIVCDYLTGHSNLSIAPYNDELIRAYPVGEERKLINKEFDKLINHFKELGLLNEREVIAEKTLDINKDKETEKSLIKEDNSMKSTYKQLSFNFDR